MTTWRSLTFPQKEALLQLATPCLTLESQRDRVLQELTRPIAAQAHRSSQMRADLIALFDTLDNFDGAWQEFVEALSFLEQYSAPSQAFAAKAAELSAWCPLQTSPLEEPFHPCPRR